MCHQLANQVLWASGLLNGGTPATVNGARGYHISSFLFGTYGHLTEDIWQQRIAQYSQQPAQENLMEAVTLTNLVNTSAMIKANSLSLQPSIDDEFSKHAKAKLTGPNANAKLQELHALRMRAFGTLDTHRMRARNSNLIAPSPEELNAHYNEVLRQAALILSADEFFEIFGIKPNTAIALVKP